MPLCHADIGYMLRCYDGMPPLFIIGCRYYHYEFIDDTLRRLMPLRRYIKLICAASLRLVYYVIDYDILPMSSWHIQLRHNV